MGHSASKRELCSQHELDKCQRTYTLRQATDAQKQMIHVQGDFKGTINISVLPAKRSRRANWNPFKKKIYRDERCTHEECTNMSSQYTMPVPCSDLDSGYNDSSNTVTSSQYSNDISCLKRHFNTERGSHNKYTADIFPVVIQEHNGVNGNMFSSTDTYDENISKDDNMAVLSKGSHRRLMTKKVTGQEIEKGSLDEKCPEKHKTDGINTINGPQTVKESSVKLKLQLESTSELNPSTMISLTEEAETDYSAVVHEINKSSPIKCDESGNDFSMAALKIPKPAPLIADDEITSLKTVGTTPSKPESTLFSTGYPKCSVSVSLQESTTDNNMSYSLATTPERITDVFSHTESDETNAVDTDAGPIDNDNASELDQPDLNKFSSIGNPSDSELGSPTRSDGTISPTLNALVANRRHSPVEHDEITGIELVKSSHTDSGLGSDSLSSNDSDFRDIVSSGEFSTIVSCRGIDHGQKRQQSMDSLSVENSLTRHSSIDKCHEICSIDHNEDVDTVLYAEDKKLSCASDVEDKVLNITPNEINPAVEKDQSDHDKDQCLYQGNDDTSISPDMSKMIAIHPKTCNHEPVLLVYNQVSALHNNDIGCMDRIKGDVEHVVQEKCDKDNEVADAITCQKDVNLNCESEKANTGHEIVNEKTEVILVIAHIQVAVYSSDVKLEVTGNNMESVVDTDDIENCQNAVEHSSKDNIDNQPKHDIEITCESGNEKQQEIPDLVETKAVSKNVEMENFAAKAQHSTTNGSKRKRRQETFCRKCHKDLHIPNRNCLLHRNVKKDMCKHKNSTMSHRVSAGALPKTPKCNETERNERNWQRDRKCDARNKKHASFAWKVKKKGKGRPVTRKDLQPKKAEKQKDSQTQPTQHKQYKELHKENIDIIIEADAHDDSGIGRSSSAQFSDAFTSKDLKLCMKPLRTFSNEIKQTLTNFFSKDRFIEDTNLQFLEIKCDAQTAKDVARTLYTAHREYTVYGLQTYFSRLNRGDILTQDEQEQFEWLRFITFGNYQGNGSAIRLARNGFRFSEEDGPAATRCFACNMMYDSWELQDNVEQIHRQESRHCAMHQSFPSSSGNVAILDDDSPASTAPTAANNTADSASSSTSRTSSSTTTRGFTSVSKPPASRENTSTASATPQAPVTSTAPQALNPTSSMSMEARAEPSTATTSSSLQPSATMNQSSLNSLADSLAGTHLQRSDNRERSSIQQSPSSSRHVSSLARSGPRSSTSMASFMATQMNNVAPGAQTNSPMTARSTPPPSGFDPRAIFGEPVPAGAFALSVANNTSSQSFGRPAVPSGNLTANSVNSGVGGLPTASSVRFGSSLSSGFPTASAVRYGGGNSGGPGNGNRGGFDVNFGGQSFGTFGGPPASPFGGAGAFSMASTGSSGAIASSQNAAASSFGMQANSSGYASLPVTSNRDPLANSRSHSSAPNIPVIPELSLPFIPDAMQQQHVGSGTPQQLSTGSATPQAHGTGSANAAGDITMSDPSTTNMKTPGPSNDNISETEQVIDREIGLRDGTARMIPGTGSNNPDDHIQIDNPRYREHATISQRVSSFSGWSLNTALPPLTMAEAGFFYVGVSDFVRCWACGGGLRNWEPGDDPMLEHTRWFGSCQYVKKKKGQDYVESVQRQQRMQQQTANQSAEIQQANSAEDPLETAAATQLREMGFQDDRISAALLSLRRQGITNFTTELAVQWLTDNTELTTHDPIRQTRRTNDDVTQTASHNNDVTQTSTTNDVAQAAATNNVAQAESTTNDKETETQELAQSGNDITPTGSDVTQTENDVTQTGSDVTQTENDVTQTGSDITQTGSDVAQAAGGQGEATSNSKRRNKKKKAKTGQRGNNTSSLPAGTENSTESGSGATAEAGPVSLIDPRTLKEENERLRELQTCKICMERSVDTTLLPCGHLVSCEICSKRLIKCPICRIRIKGQVKTFLS